MKPKAAAGMFCPLWRKDVSKVCHSCAWFSCVSGVHPQTGDRLERWECAVTAQVIATLEAARASHSTADVTQQLRNDQQRERQAHTRLLTTQLLRSNGEPRHIEHVERTVAD